MIDLTSAVLMVHEYAGIAWYGEVFFITFVLLPTMERLPADSKGPLMLRLFPRIFNAATVTSSLTVAAGLILALLYSNLDVSIFLRGAWGLAILLGGVMGLFMFVLHMTVEAVELRALRGIDSISAREFPPPLVAMEERVRLLPRVGFVVLTAALLLMMYAAHGA